MPRDTNATRRKLFDAAVALIGEHGFHGTTVDDIVEYAGVAKGTVYYHFKSKTELVHAMLEDGLDRFGAVLTERSNSAKNPTAALEAIVRAQVSYIKRYEAFAKLLLSEMWRDDREWAELVRLLRARLVDVIKDTIDRGVASGEFRDDVDTGLAAAGVFGMAATAALDWRVFAPARPEHEVADAITELTLTSLRRL